MAKYNTHILYDQSMNDNDEFKEFVASELKQSFVDLILSELEKNEKICLLGKPCTRSVPELCQVEAKLDLTMTDLIRCKDCSNWEYGFCYCFDTRMPESGFCSCAERKEHA